MSGDPIFRFAVIGDVSRNNKSCMAGVSHVLTRLRKLGVRSVLFAEEREWRLVDVEEKGKSFDLGAAAVAALEEKRPAIEYVERGGFGFVLCSEKGLSEKAWTPFAEKMMERLKRAKVFFYAQIYHPAGTVAGDFVPKQDGGFSTAALSGMRNCVAFSVGREDRFPTSVRQGRGISGSLRWRRRRSAIRSCFRGGTPRRNRRSRREQGRR